MVPLENAKNVLFKYIRIFQISNVRKKNYIIVVFLTLLTVVLDAAGISILVPIGEYILNYNTNEMPNTIAWKMLDKIFFYLGLDAKIEFVVFFAILLMILRQAVVFTRMFLMDIIEYTTVQNLREKLFVKFLRQDLYFIKEQSTGIYNNIINVEVLSVAKSLVLPLQNISGIILIFSYLAFMMFISVPATLTVMIFMIFTGVILKKFLFYIKSTATKIIKINNHFSQNLVDRLMAIKLIRISNKIGKEKEYNKKILSKQYINNINLTRIQRIIDCAIEPMILMVAIPVIILAIKLNFPLAQLGVFIILLARFIPVFKLTVSGVQAHFVQYASIKNMLTLIDEVNSQKEIREGNLDMPKIFNSITFKNVYFGYKDSKKHVLKNFSCEIKGGKINALIGTSGSGKTTLINMIPRLLEPTRGKILINDINVKNINVNKIREVCAYIEQKATFIRGTISEHISYNNLRINKKVLVEAAKLSNAHNFIMNLPEKYNYSLGESGTGLSGGQLQRLDIARGISSGKPLMILDEPTSNLDPKNSTDLLLTLRKINKIKNTTILIISHDTSILKFCDNIIKI